MGKRHFAIEKDGPKRLTIQWRGIWKEVEVLVDDQRLGEPFPNLRALKQGRDFVLADGRTLYVGFFQSFGRAGLDLKVDGVPLLGTGRDPRAAIKVAAIWLFVMSGISILGGIIGLASPVVARFGFGWPSLVAGAVLGVLGFLVLKKRSRVALAIAIAIVLVDTALTFVVYAQVGGRGGVPTGLFLRGLMLFALFSSWRALGEVKKVEERELTDTFR
jgi:hypothetical protein